MGAIVASHPEVAYRFEPFVRAQRLGDDQKDSVGRMLDIDQLADLDVGEIYEALLQAYPEWDKPPFFRKRYRTRVALGRSILWVPARRSRLAGKVFRALYTPTDRPYVVFKEVAYEEAFRALVLQTEIPLIYLIRHPCAIVHSTTRGEQQGLMGSGRRDVLCAYLKDHALDLWRRYGDRIGGMTPHQKEALLWRANVERCFSACDERESAMVVYYENLCADPLQVGSSILGTLGLGMDPQVHAFIDRSTDTSARRRGRISEMGIDKYFSVFRDPRVAMNAWKTGLTREQRDEVLDLVRDSPVFEHGARNAQWDA